MIRLTVFIILTTSFLATTSYGSSTKSNAKNNPSFVAEHNKLLNNYDFISLEKNKRYAHFQYVIKLQNKITLTFSCTCNRPAENWDSYEFGEYLEEIGFILFRHYSYKREPFEIKYMLLNVKNGERHIIEGREDFWPSVSPDNKRIVTNGLKELRIYQISDKHITLETYMPEIPQKYVYILLGQNGYSIAPQYTIGAGGYQTDYNGWQDNNTIMFGYEHENLEYTHNYQHPIYKLMFNGSTWDIKPYVQ